MTFEAIINDPNKLEPLLKETIDSLKNREEELRARILPIDERLADDWVILNMDSSRYNEIQHGLDQEETRLRFIRNEVDPAQLEETASHYGLEH